MSIIKYTRELELDYRRKMIFDPDNEKLAAEFSRMMQTKEARISYDSVAKDRIKAMELSVADANKGIPTRNNYPGINYRGAWVDYSKRPESNR